MKEEPIASLTEFRPKAESAAPGQIVPPTFEKRSEPTQKGDADSPGESKNEATAESNESEPPRPVYRPTRSRGVGVTLLMQLFRLSTKFVPIAGVLAGGYSSYTYFFGPVPVVEKAVMELGGGRHGPAEKSKVAQMLAQTRDVVAKSDARVLAANALADGPVGDSFDAEELAVTTTSVAARELTVPEPASISILDQFSSFEAERAAIKTEPSSTYSFQQTAELEPEVISEVEPSSDFLAWAQNLKIGGVRKGSEPRVFINGLTLKVGSKADHGLGITFVGLTEDGMALVFRDTTNATVIKRY